MTPKMMHRIMLAVITTLFLSLLGYALYKAGKFQLELAEANILLNEQAQQLAIMNAALESADIELQRLQQIQRDTAVIQAEYEKQIKALLQDNADQLSVINQLGNSTDEKTVHWAAAELPVAVIGLLKHQPGANRSPDQNGSHSST